MLGSGECLFLARFYRSPCCIRPELGAKRTLLGHQQSGAVNPKQSLGLNASGPLCLLSRLRSVRDFRSAHAKLVKNVRYQCDKTANENEWEGVNGDGQQSEIGFGDILTNRFKYVFHQPALAVSQAV